MHLEGKVAHKDEELRLALSVSYTTHNELEERTRNPAVWTPTAPAHSASLPDGGRPRTQARPCHARLLQGLATSCCVRPAK